MEYRHFAAGRMLPKVKAAMRFVENGGKRAIITSQEKVFESPDSKDVTTVVPDG